MCLRNNVTFRTSIPFDVNLHPVGEEVASHLAIALESLCGLSASIDIWRDSGFELDVEINGKRMHFAFVYVEDRRFQFYGQIGSYVGWLRRLFGYRDQDEEQILIRALHVSL